MIPHKEMNRKNSLIILAAITLGIVLVFTTITIPMGINVSAESAAEKYEKEEGSYYYQQERDEYYYPPRMDGYDPSELPDYIPSESYGDGYYDIYESGYYEEQGFGMPYDIE